MKKSIIKLTVFCLVFLLAAVIVNKIMNRGHDNLTWRWHRPAYRW